MKTNMNKKTATSAANTSSRKSKKTATRFVVTKCSECNKPFRYDPENGEKHLCKACQAKADAEWAKEHTVVCKDCGQKFLISKGEFDYYAERQLEQPKRCRSCRNYRKMLKAKGELPRASVGNKTKTKAPTKVNATENGKTAA